MLVLPLISYKISVQFMALGRQLHLHLANEIEIFQLDISTNDKHEVELNS